MLNFSFKSSTEVVYGKNTEMMSGELLKKYGGKSDKADLQPTWESGSDHRRYPADRDWTSGEQRSRINASGPPNGGPANVIVQM